MILSIAYSKLIGISAFLIQKKIAADIPNNTIAKIAYIKRL